HSTHSKDSKGRCSEKKTTQNVSFSKWNDEKPHVTCLRSGQQMVIDKVVTILNVQALYKLNERILVDYHLDHHISTYERLCTTK
ncbi:hypothetical protein FRX31_031060, partial [Thalictrum thalictroides]